MSEDIKIYHVETQEDYDDLMIELEEQGYRWSSEDLPTEFKKEVWDRFRENTYILSHEDSKRISYGYMGITNFIYPKESIIKHKAKGVNQMEKVVVPQFVADWYEKYKKGRTIYGIIGLLNDLSKCNNEKMFTWKMNCEGRTDHELGNAQEVIAKMHLYGYEVEEKKYYWRKKNEYMFSFDKQDNSYLNVNKETGNVFFGTKVQTRFFQTLLTETQVRRVISEEDFNKLERVEKDAN